MAHFCLVAIFTSFIGQTSFGDNERLSALQIKRIEQITTYFENSTTVFAYGYAENIHDGHGDTVGRVGFCTGTSDAWQVVDRYCQLKKPRRAPLCSYVPALLQLHLQHVRTGQPVSSLKGLNGFRSAWRRAAKDALFRAVQDHFVKTLYLDPTLKLAQEIGVRTPIGIAILYDSSVQHGGLSAFIAATQKRIGRLSDVGEIKWLNAFLDTRKDVLLHAPNDENKVWAASADRVDWLRKIMIDQNNIRLDRPAVLEDGAQTD